MLRFFYLLILTTSLFACNTNVQPQVETGEEELIESIETFCLSQDSIKQLSLPDSLYFAGERVPLERQDVKERLEYELYALAFRHSRTSIVYKRFTRWAPVLSKRLSEHKLPEDLLYIAVTESDLDLNVKSPAGAMGVWQLMPATARELGLKVNRYVDQRRDPWEATDAVASYVTKAYEKFGSWFLVAAGYNRGVSGVNNQLEKQKVTSYFDLFLNEETARYVFRILAYKIILNDPASFGYHIPEAERYKPLEFDTLVVKKSIKNMADFAIEHKTTYAELRRYNPWLANSDSMKLPIKKGEEYVFRLPKNRTVE